MWRALWAAAVNSLFPPRCLGPGCGARGYWLCDRCLSLVAPLPAPLCGRCGVPVMACGWCIRCAAHEPPFERARAAGRFDGVLREAIHALKYRGRTAVARPLGYLAAAAFGLPPADALVVPVPAHGQRLQERGVDHALEIAQAAAEAWARPCEPGALRRIRNTRPQTALSPAQRRANVAAAFVAGPLDGSKIVLVDDVMTSGATVSSCALALLAAGASLVQVCTVARATGRAGRWPCVQVTEPDGPRERPPRGRHWRPAAAATGCLVTRSK